MKNNHGQVLVIFVILLPLLIMFSFYVVDTSYMAYHKNRLDNINAIICDYAITHENVNEDDIGKLLRKNDKNAVIKKIELKDKVNIDLEVEVPSLFGRIIGKNSYKIKSSISKNKVSKDKDDTLDETGEEDEED